MSSEPTVGARCAQCGAELGAAQLVCPSCRALLHAGELKQLAAQATERQQAGDISGALAAWRRALDLLPEGTRQHGEVAARIDHLGRMVDAPPPPSRNWLGRGGTIGAALIAIASKAKFVLLGLTKMSTLLSMIAYAGVYWALWGWKFGVGLVLSIYIHEMGHVIMLRHYGVDASAPMFIPGLGAVVRLKQRLTDSFQDARIGLAGPRWGLGASLASFVVYLCGGSTFWLALAQLSGWINLFNLLPVWQLDGGRAFGGLNRTQQLLMALLLGGAYFLSREWLVGILALVALWRALPKRPEQPASWAIFVEYATLMAALVYLAALKVPGLAR